MLQKMPHFTPSQAGDDSLNFSILDSSINEPNSSRGQTKPANSATVD